MSCCGNKRSQLNRSEKPVLERASRADAWTDPSHAESQALSHSLSHSEREAPIRENAPRMFEYLGSSSLVVTGAITRRRYHFAFPGHSLEIAYEDSFAIMAEGELKRV